MTGDKYKPEPWLFRMIGTFDRNHLPAWVRRTAETSFEKRYNRRWRRHEAKRAMEV